MDVNGKKSEFESNGFCILKGIFANNLIDELRTAFWEIMNNFLSENSASPNRGPFRYFMAMPFIQSIFLQQFFFNPIILEIVKSLLGDKIVADQWGCDIPVFGSEYQNPHIDYQRPLFHEQPDLLLPAYMIVVSFGLLDIGQRDGMIEIAPGTQALNRETANQLVITKDIPLVPVALKKGDVLIRHPWAIHRGSPNLTMTPRALVTIRYVRQWYHDNSRDVNAIPLMMWERLSVDQQRMLRFPVVGL